ncbi:MAG: cytochrome d ubiquinol oxidase subunit II [Rhodoblastus sp.]|jgi:cytochrome d ubiquinol oxidase subunit II
MIGAIDLAFVWAAIIAFAVLLYTLLDGFDLGIGILFPFVRDGDQRGRMLSSIAPVWDGNETWLVLGGGGLLAVFPLAYSIILSALYAPIIFMLLSLVFRGVAFEFRWQTPRARKIWDRAFALGSLGAAVAQGLALGALVQGIPVSGRAYAGGWWDWLTPFSLLTALGLTLGYALQGACWLIMKTDGRLQRRAYDLARFLAPAFLAAIAAVSLWTPFLSATYSANWFSWPRILLVAPVPLLVAAAGFALITGIAREKERSPYFATQALFILGFAGLGVSFYPFMVPNSVTIWQAAAPDASLAFLLAGAAPLLVVILAYTSYAYWVFRGKTPADHHGY